MPRKPYRRLRVFCSTFMLTLCMLLLVCGFLVAEYNTRRTAFGETRLRMPYTQSDGEGQPPDWIREWSGRLQVLVPARVRTAAWLIQGEQALVPSGIEWWREQQRDADGTLPAP